MSDDLRQSGDPNGSGDVTSPDSVDLLGADADADATPSNAREWKIKADKVYEEYLSSCPGYPSSTATSSEKFDHRDICRVKVMELAAYTLLSLQ